MIVSRNLGYSGKPWIDAASIVGEGRRDVVWVVILYRGISGTRASHGWLQSALWERWAG